MAGWDMSSCYIGFSPGYGILELEEAQKLR